MKNSGRRENGLAARLPAFPARSETPQAAVMGGNTPEEGRIAVIYNRGERPPEITVTQQAAQVQTVHANGVAVAIVAKAEGAEITARDILLVERVV